MPTDQETPSVISPDARESPTASTITEKSPADQARERAAQYMSEHRFVDARKALEEAEALEAEPLKDRAQRVMSNLRSRLPKRAAQSNGAAASQPTDGAAAADAVDKSIRTVNLFSKIAAVVGLLPGGLLNFAAILVVQVTMVIKIANNFGHKEGKERVRGSILSLLGSMLPTGIGHGAGLAIAAIPAVITGTVVYFLVTPVLAYALTQAVGKVFIMHFESGGTLLTFDPKAFADYFLQEFKRAGGTVKTEAEMKTSEPAPATA